MISLFPPKTICQHVYNPRQTWRVDTLQSVNSRQMTKCLQPASNLACRHVDTLFQGERQKQLFFASKASTEAL